MKTLKYLSLLAITPYILSQETDKNKLYIGLSGGASVIDHYRSREFNYTHNMTHIHKSHRIRPLIETELGILHNLNEFKCLGIGLFARKILTKSNIAKSIGDGNGSNNWIMKSQFREKYALGITGNFYYNLSKKSSIYIKAGAVFKRITINRTFEETSNNFSNTTYFDKKLLLPVIGVGFKTQITDRAFCTFEYSHELPVKKFKLQKEGIEITNCKSGNGIVKLGIGFNL
ncbi:MAG: hypothetical protein IJ481_01020 [Alphaproteobacteria bacterium]|nr:hypothetical protein [Alphaproteobacteria bacterium]